jgi:hypothetical protein
MTRIVIFAAMLALVGCAAQLEVIGPYANQLSKSDIQQITALITPSSYVSHVYTRLNAVRPKEVRIEYGGYSRSRDGFYGSDTAATFFTAYNRGGRWVAGNDVEVESRFMVY